MFSHGFSPLRTRFSCSRRPAGFRKDSGGYLLPDSRRARAVRRAVWPSAAWIPGVCTRPRRQRARLGRSVEPRGCGAGEFLGPDHPPWRRVDVRSPAICVPGLRIPAFSDDGGAQMSKPMHRASRRNAPTLRRRIVWTVSAVLFAYCIDVRCPSIQCIWERDDSPTTDEMFAMIKDSRYILKDSECTNIAFEADRRTVRSYGWQTTPVNDQSTTTGVYLSRDWNAPQVLTPRNTNAC